MQNKIKVIEVKPNTPPKVIEFEDTLENLQNEVEGIIDMIYIDDEVAIVLNDEGKIYNLPPNRPLKNERGEVVDVIVGNFLIVGARADSDSFSSLTDEEIKKYMEEFAEPINVENEDLYKPLTEPYIDIIPTEWVEWANEK